MTEPKNDISITFEALTPTFAPWHISVQVPEPGKVSVSVSPYVEAQVLAVFREDVRTALEARIGEEWQKLKPRGAD